MAYRYEKESNGKQALVIDGWEKGIADSPYKGIANMRNVNTKYADGVAYVNYKRQAATISGGTMKKPTFQCQSPAGINYILDSGGQVWKQSGVGSSTFNLLPGNPTNGAAGNGIQYWNNYLFVFRNSFIDICGDGTGDNGIIFANWNFHVAFTLTTTLSAGATSATLTSACSSSADTIWFSDGEQRTLTGGAGGTNLTWSGGLTNNVTASVALNNNRAISGYLQWPIASTSIGGVTLTGSVSVNATTASISSYNDANGVSQSVWTGPTGTYQMQISPNGAYITSAYITVTLTYNSAVINFSAVPWGFRSAVSIIFTTGNTNMSIVSRENGNMYFTNGQYIGTIAVPSLFSFDGGTFQPNDPNSFVVNYGSGSSNNNTVTAQGSILTAGNAVSLHNGDTAVWLEELNGQLLIATANKIYRWDFANSNVQTPIPMYEQIYRMINILNNIYIFAGSKGNIYLSNGYSIFPFKKIPDCIATSNYSGSLTNGSPVIDPQWLWGGIMQHRQRLVFQATAVNSQNTSNILMQGIFSLTVTNPTMITGLETVGALTVEAQNSTGVVPSAGVQGGILIDDFLGIYPYDNYYTVYPTGTYTGNIDYNNTTLWSGNEPWIETDLIPVGTFLQPGTLSNMEFKLDQPMKSGDSITVYARKSLSDTYVLVGTTAGSTLQLSDKYQQNFDQAQWLQFAIAPNCNATATSSSFVRLREIRIR